MKLATIDGFARAPCIVQPTPPPAANATSIAAIAPIIQRRGGRASASTASRAGTGSSATASYFACSAALIARHDAAFAASSGWLASQASTACRRSAGSSSST